MTVAEVALQITLKAMDHPRTVGFDPRAMDDAELVLKNAENVNKFFNAVYENLKTLD